MVHDPLTSTFCFSEGIGLGTERKLWDNGVVHWDHVSAGSFAHLSSARTRSLRRAIDRARADLQADRVDFARDGLANRELWRAFPRFRNRCVYLDIETTGLDPWSHVTLIGLYDAGGLTILQRGKNLDRFPSLMAKYEFIVSFNGRTFDVPFLKREFPRWRVTQAHWDLRFALRNAGHEGGLKDIERRLDLHRPGPLANISGEDAPTLWEFHKEGDPDALPILRRYLAEDVMGLAPLAERAFNLLAAAHPLEVARLSQSAKPDCDLEYNPRAIRRLLG